MHAERTSRHASPDRAEMLLDVAKRQGDIFGYERVNAASGVRWLVQTQPTRYEKYNDENARGEIVLTTREAFAFIEGIYAGRRIQPVRRAGDTDG